MPSRFPPSEPVPPKGGSTPKQLQRYRHALHAWYVGNALREYAEFRKGTGRSILDDISLLPSPRLDGVSGGRRYADDGTPRTMDDVCAAIDRQARTVAPVGDAYLRLCVDKPPVAQAAWRRHVLLMSVDEIAQAQGVSSRTVIRMLGIANLYLMAALSGAPRGKTARELQRKSDRLEDAPIPSEMTDDDWSFAGVEPPAAPAKGTR